jgi:REP element-mobilizing transposase RayT
MTQYPRKRRRNSMRHVNHDYTAPGAYFVTICVQDRRPLFGRVVQGTMYLSALGAIAHHCWPAVTRHHKHVQLDTYIVMPNHVHVLLLLLAPPNKQSRPQRRQFARPVAGSISTLVGTYKAEVTRRARRAGLAPPGKLWQRNFWDSIVRDQQGLDRVRRYIETNPQRWNADRLHPTAPPPPPPRRRQR